MSFSSGEPKNSRLVRLLMISVFVKIHRGKTGVFLNDGSLLFDRNGQEYNPQTSRQKEKDASPKNAGMHRGKHERGGYRVPKKGGYSAGDSSCGRIGMKWSEMPRSRQYCSAVEPG